MAVKASHVTKNIGDFTGFCPKDIIADKGEEFYGIWNRLFEKECQFIDKDKAEKDPEWKQVIPYFIFVNKDSIMSYDRGTETEKRLHGSKSIGVGGHIEPFDGIVPSEAYFTGAQRELLEEVSVLVEFPSINNSFIGIINDNASEVSRVHVGLAHIIILNNEEREMIEASKSAIGKIEFVKIDELQGKMGEYESWSQHAIKMISRQEEPKQEMIAFLSEAIRLASNLIYPASTRLISTSMPMNHVLEMEISASVKNLTALFEQARKEEVL